MNEPLFSVIILCYRKFEYLYSAIDSVLKQDYPNIEIVVSDDGSDGFPRERIESYIAAYKGPNITHTIVRQQPQNSGTVHHLNDAIPVCNGTYIVSLAADDNFYDEHVISSYVAGFMQAPENCYIEMAHTGMYDERLATLEEYYLNLWVQQAIEQTETDSSALYACLIRLGACLPSTSTCFKKEFFDRYGKFDESYALVEDYPTHVRLAKEGWIIHYANFVAVKHRHGGISHGQSNTLSRSKKLYFEDSIRTIEDVIFQNLDILPPDEQDIVRRRKTRERDWLLFSMARLSGNRQRMLSLALRHPLYGLTVFFNILGGCVQRIWKKMFFMVLSLFLFSPTAAQMFETVSGYSAADAAKILAIFTNITFVLWLVCIAVMVIHKLLQAIQRFPQERLMVG